MIDATRRKFGATVVGLTGLTLSRPARAAPPSGGRIRARLEPPSVQLEEESELSVEVEVADSRIEVSRPRIAGAKELALSAIGSTMSTSVVYDNGRPRMSQTRVFSYLLSSTKVGTFELSIEAEVGDAVIKLAKPLVFKVTDDPAARAANIPKLGEDDTVLVTKASPQVVYVGQQVDYVYEAWERGENQLQPDKLPAFRDCWVEALPRPEARIERVNGVRYRVHTPMLQAVFPQRAGALVIGSPTLRVQPSSFGMLFGGRQAGRPRVIAGPEQTIHVLALPTAGQPPNFAANNVGSYTLVARVDRQEIVQGDAVSLVLELSGEGNIRFAELEPWPAIAGVRRYDPKPEDAEIDTTVSPLRGKKHWSILLIAQEAGKIEIPSHAIAFFDPKAKRYDRSQSQPLIITVSAKPGFVSDAKTAEPVQDQAGAPSRPEATQEAKHADLLQVAATGPIDRIALAQLVQPRSSLRSFWLSWGAIPLGFAGLFSGLSLARRVWANPQRAAAAAQRAREHELLDKLDAKASDSEFLAAVNTLLQQRVLAFLGPAAQGVPRAKMLQFLQQAKVAPAEIENVGHLLERCDAARFGAGVLDPGTRSALAAQLKALLQASHAWRKGAVS